MSRRRPLLTCGASLLAVIHNACRKAQELNGPLGKWAKRIIKFMSLAFPIMYVVLYQWLAILSFTDDCILTFEKLVETIFPPSTCLFDKIDKLVYTAEVMPGRFDEALNRFLVIMHRVSFLDWVLMQIIWWVYGDHMHERDIMIDMNSNSGSNVTESAENANCPSQEAPSIYCPPEEKVFEAGKPESNAELPALAQSENKEKYTVENEVKTDNANYTVESSTMNQSRDRISAPLVDSSQELVNHVQLPSIAASLDRSSEERRKSIEHVHLPRTAAPVGSSSQDKRKSVGHVEFPNIADPPGDSSREKKISVDHVQLPGTAKKEELPRNKSLEDGTTQDKTKSIGVKLESDIDKGAERKTFGKQTEAENTQEGSRQSSVSKEKVGRDEEKGTEQSVEDKDPVLELFESKWHL